MAIQLDLGVRIPMRDGVTLCADIYREQSGTRSPVLIMRTPYDRRRAETMVYAHPSWYARQGFAVVVQDVRGRFGSEGSFEPLLHEAADGADTVGWAVGQPWSNGRVGMYGFSYPGLLQMQAATERPDGLMAIAPGLAPVGLERILRHGGEFALGHTIGWALDLGVDLARRTRPDLTAAFLAAGSARAAHYASRPLRGHDLLVGSGVTPFFSDWLDRMEQMGGADRTSVAGRWADIDIPAFHIGGWDDIFVDSTIEAFFGLRGGAASAEVRSSQQLMIGPWHHNPRTSTPPGNPRHIDDAQLAFFRRWLFDDDAGFGDAVSVYRTGEERWLTPEDWPLATAEQQWYLHSGGRANGVSGDGQLSLEDPEDEAPDVYVHDPTAPVPAIDSQASGFPLIVPMGRVDQATVEVRPDVLVYTSVPLHCPTTVSGEVRAVLHAGTTAATTDWVVTLCEVDVAGASRNLVRGIASVGSKDDTAAMSCSLHCLQVSLGFLEHCIPVGHRLRVQVASSCYPLWIPNPGIRGRLGAIGAEHAIIATQVVLHERGSASYISIPIIAS